MRRKTLVNRVFLTVLALLAWIGAMTGSVSAASFGGPELPPELPPIHTDPGIDVLGPGPVLTSPTLCVKDCPGGSGPDPKLKTRVMPMVPQNCQNQDSREQNCQ